MPKYSWLLLFHICFCQPGPPEHHYFLNPGVKLGYAFGEGGGLVYGCELSFVITGRDSKHSSNGVTFNYDFIPNGHRLHVGYEYLSPFAGFDIGPTMITTKTKNDFGFSIIPFAGILAIPYYNFTYVPSLGAVHEVGSLLKIPIQTDHYTYNWQNSD